MAKLVRCLGAALVFCVVLAVSAGTESHAQEQDIRSNGTISTTVLSNGVRVIVEPRHSVAITAIDVWVEAGTRMERPGEEGAAHYLEHLIFTGTPSHPNDGDIDGAIEDLGGSLDAATSYDWAHFYTTVPADSMSGALGVVADAVEHASLTSAQVESERPIIIAEIERTSDDPASFAEQSVRRQIFGDSYAYGRPITGSEEQVQGLSRDTIVGFYRRCYVPSATCIVICGDTTVQKAVSAAEAAFGTWSGPQSPDAPKPPDVTPIQPSREVVDRDAGDATMTLGWRAPGVMDKPDAWVMDVLLTYLGQGAIDLLDTDLHLKQHLVKSISADFLTQHNPGLMTVTATLSPENVAPAEAQILKDVKSVQDTPLNNDQLASAKNQLIASYTFDTETVSGTADSLGFYEMIDSYKYDADYIDHVNSVTAQQVQDLAKKYLSDTNFVETVVTPSQAPESASLGMRDKVSQVPSVTLVAQHSRVD